MNYLLSNVVITEFEEEGDDFGELELYSLVELDHVFWPRNDFYLGSRVIYDGVKVAVTDVMTKISGY